MRPESGPTGSGAAGPDPVELLVQASAFSAALEAHRAQGRSVGVVPTMGALHDGHASLIRRAASECDVVAVTVFVNPLQFGESEDFERYPRSLRADLDLAAAFGARLLFAPPVEEMFPGAPAATETTVHVDGPSRGLEGDARPGHFDGVATVVAKLFGLAGRCRAYFGEKDFQQLAVVRRMAADLSFPVEVIACKTVRDTDGLALSSRNALLDPSDRQVAPLLYHALQQGAAAVSGGATSPATIAHVMAQALGTEPRIEIDYAVAVDPVTLTAPDVFTPGDEVRLLVAARLGAVRLIDNLGARVPAPVTTSVADGPTREVDTACAGA